MKIIENTFVTWDGTRLFYRAWLPEKEDGKPCNRALLLFHRGHEHSGRWSEFVQELALPDVAVFAWDARGHGHSPGERGSAEHLSAIIKDLDEFAHHVSSEYEIPIANMIILAHSVGAVTAAAWVHDYAPPVRAMILATPAFRVKLYVPFALPLLRLRQRFLGHGCVKSYVKANMLTHDPEQAAQYEADQLIFRQIAVNILLDLHDTSTRLLADAGAIRVPTLVLAAESDWVVKVSAQKQFFENLSSPVKEMETLPGFSHAIFHEKERRRVVELIRQFILERFKEPAPESSLIEADRRGYTREEFDRLCQPGSARFKLMKGATRFGGLFSNGIKLGWQSGFDSGLALDYVYENRPRGFTALGRFVDKCYLESIGWRGIRQRRTHLQAMLREIIARVHHHREEVRILDIAAGAGRYVLETMRSLPQIPCTAVLRDYKSENVNAARALAQQLGLSNVTVREGDAFDRCSVATACGNANIGIVSGLYELIPSNDPVLASLRGLADAIEPGGYLIYTNQPWHPQLEFIARVLTNREGKPWIMRRRAQAEMDELVRVAGFEKLSMQIDRWGMFTVSLARRTARPSARATHETTPFSKLREPVEQEV
jgi:alpha-beta hydrolase superfamily lysophospholipase/SAM-dependent methyltransferase